MNKIFHFLTLLICISITFPNLSFGGIKFEIKKAQERYQLYLANEEGSHSDFICDLITLPAQTSYYSWQHTDKPHQEPLIKFIHETQPELALELITEYLNTEIDYNRGCAGGGFYVSLDPFDSKSFGPTRLEGASSNDLIIAPKYLDDVENRGRNDSVNKKLSEECSGQNRPSCLKSLAEAGVHGIFSTTAVRHPEDLLNPKGQKWINFIHPEPLKSIQFSEQVEEVTF